MTLLPTVFIDCQIEYWRISKKSFLVEEEITFDSVDKMFKTGLIVMLILGTALASRDIDDLENVIDYGDSPYRAISLPYPYRDSNEERFAVKPYYEKNYGEILVPKVPKVATMGFFKSGLILSIVTFAITLVKKVFSFVFMKGPALIVGGLAILEICKFTPLCTKLCSFKSLVEVQREIRSLATPERLAAAAEFVQMAIRKYRSLQDSED